VLHHVLHHVLPLAALPVRECAIALQPLRLC
jgi:hypothetical protein